MNNYLKERLDNKRYYLEEGSKVCDEGIGNYDYCGSQEFESNEYISGTVMLVMRFETFQSKRAINEFILDNKEELFEILKGEIPHYYDVYHYNELYIEIEDNYSFGLFLEYNANHE